MRYYDMDLDEQHMRDLQPNIEATRGIQIVEPPAERLVGIVDEDAGGIIAYAIGWENADKIRNALRVTEPGTPLPVTYIDETLD